ncbi:MAG TPA: hypothetical protein VGE72_18205 [Azospirillum sp.]
MGGAAGLTAHRPGGGGIGRQGDIHPSRELRIITIDRLLSVAIGLHSHFPAGLERLPNRRDAFVESRILKNFEK